MSETFSYTLSDPAGISVIEVTVETPATDTTGSGDSYSVTAISGTIEGQTITGEIGTGGAVVLSADGVFLYDNDVFVSASGGEGGSTLGIDNDGLLFEAGGLEYNLSSSSGSLSVTSYDGSTSNETQQPETVLASDAPCYCSGTLILTDHGEIAVEVLAIGDVVVTASGRHEPIRWIGHRQVDTAAHPNPRAVWPVRVIQGAFGINKPSRDLWTSPDHCVHVDGHLIEIKRLINDATIVQTPVGMVSYWHVELESHDILVADGMEAESYLDTGNRTAFANGGAFIELCPSFAPRHWRDTCLPMIWNGAPLTAIRTALLSRAEAIGFVWDEDHGLHVLFDGRRIEAISVKDGKYTFVLPPGGKEIRLVSKTWVPAAATAASEDIRTLGVCIERLQIDGADWALAALPGEGWHPTETYDGFQQRWTDGEAHIPSEALLVVVDVIGAGRYLKVPHVASTGDELIPVAM